jgi:hypothetical protein
MVLPGFEESKWFPHPGLMASFQFAMDRLEEAYPDGFVVIAFPPRAA